MNINQTPTNFTSTKVSSKDLFKAVDKLSPYFELKGFGLMKNEAVRERIVHSQAGVLMEKDSITFIGKDREADSFISRMLDNAKIENKYVQDTPETKFDGQVFDLNI